MGLSDLVKDGQRLLLDQLGLGEDQLRLIGKLAWLKTDDKVSFMSYSHHSPSQSSCFYVKFKQPISVSDFEKFLGKYEIQTEYKIEGPEAVLRPWNEVLFKVLFAPIER